MTVDTASNYQAVVYDSLDFVPGASDVELNTNRIQLMRRFAEQQAPGATICDIGCADGSFLRLLEGYRLLGVEVSEVLARRAVQNGIETILGNVEHGVPLESGTVDCVVTGETIEHVPDTDHFLGEINRVLRPGGWLILSCPNVNTLVSPLMMVLLDTPPQLSARYRSPHVKDFTSRTLRMAVENNGFSVESMVGSEIYLPGLGGVLPRLALRLPRIAKEIVLLAQKQSDTTSKRGRVEQRLHYGRPRGRLSTGRVRP